MWREPFENVGSGYLAIDSATDLGALADELTEARWYVGRCDVATVDDKATLINAIATGMGFPEWTARNWDALADSLTDLSWIDESAVVLLLEGSDGPKSAAPRDWQTAREVLVDAAAWWETRPKTLIVLVA